MSSNDVADSYVLVLDTGSSSIRCHAVGTDGSVASTATRPWTYLEELDTSQLARAFDLRAVWRSACDVILEVSSGVREIAAVSITSQRQSVVFLDEGGEPLYAGPNTDLRAVFEGSALDFESGDSLYQTTGHRPAFMMASGKLAWLRERRPKSYARLAHVLTLADWLAFKLTGETGCEPTLAASSGLLDISSRAWASDLFDQVGLECRPSRLVEATEIRGAVAASEARSVSGTPVVVAGGDTQCALIGLGVVEPGGAGVVAGWSATVQLLSSKPLVSGGMKTWTELFQVPGVWAVESSAGDAGNAYRWLAETVFGGEGAYSHMDELAASVPVGSEGVTAHLGPQRMDVSRLGLQVGGLLLPVPMSLGGPTPGQIARAALEGFAYALRGNLEQAEEIAGATASSVAFGGGMLRSASFSRILPDIIGREVWSGRGPEATARGAALVARTAIGEFRSISQAAESAREMSEVARPDAQAAAEYEDHYRAWLESQRVLAKMPS